MFVTPGSFTPPGRVMLQFSSPRLVASHKVVGSTSKAGKRVILIADLLKKGGPQSALYYPNRLDILGPDRWSCHAVSSASEMQLPLDTPDLLTCGPTAMTRAIATLGGEAYLDGMMGRLLPIFIYLEGAHAFCMSIFGGDEHLCADVRKEPRSGR